MICHLWFDAKEMVNFKVVIVLVVVELGLHELVVHRRELFLDAIGKCGTVVGLVEE